MHVKALFSTLAIVAGVSADLRSRLNAAGVQAVYPGDPNYARLATPFNKRFSYRPVAIAYPNSAAQVSAAVKAGVAEKVYINARGGGHSYTAYAFGGENGHFMIDLKSINLVTVDSATNIATIGAGGRLGDIASGLDQHGGRALPHGVCPYVGIGGHAGYGGWGFTSRQWGLTLDTLVAYDIVLANGTAQTVTSDSNPDLFWALRGAAPSFAIVTAYHAKTQPAPVKATQYEIRWTNLSPSASAKLLQTWQDFTINQNLPAEIGVTINVFKGSQGGTLSFSFAGGYYGTADPQSVIQGWLSQQPTPSFREFNSTAWLPHLQNLAGKQKLSSTGVDLTAEHDTFYAKSLITRKNNPVSAKAFQAFANYLISATTDTAWFIQWELYGGQNSAITSVPQDATAFADRDAHFNIQFYASSHNYSPPYPSAGFTFLDGVVNSIINNQPSGWPYGAYTNYVDDRLSTQQWRDLYYGSHYQRLSNIKAQVDPYNVFKFPQAILPPSKSRRERVI